MFDKKLINYTQPKVETSLLISCNNSKLPQTVIRMRSHGVSQLVDDKPVQVVTDLLQVDCPNLVSQAYYKLLQRVTTSW